MTLSVVIVNYNVEHFLEQCLLSVEKSCEGIESEVFVVDNNSVDGSVEMVKQKFPWVKLIENKDNKGFSRANNQALKQAKGKYCLLLNPDTLVEDDTFGKCIRFMDENDDCGGLGVKMVDGKGRFLPESKRGLPTPRVAFYKIFGLSRLFPSSKVFGKYHLGFLNKDKTHEVDVLSGAFMLMRKEALDKTGLLDEEFFMYGEDIDLSYRITKAGYKNFYYPGTRIIHYKGESTKKGSFNYVYIFYKAMAIFARKHFTHKKARLFSLLINMAIFFRAGLSILKRFFKGILLPLLDAGVIFAGFHGIRYYWENFVKAGEGMTWPAELLNFFVPAYIIIWLITLYFSGAYDKPIRFSKIFQGIGIGTVIILVGYALLPESLRFSRALIVLGAVWSALALPFYRLLLNLAGFRLFTHRGTNHMRFAVVGSSEETERVAQIVRKTHPDAGFIGLVNNEQEKNENTIGSPEQLNDIIRIYQIDEVIFCSKDLVANNIIDVMTSGLPGSVDFKIAPPESLYLIGSNSIHTAGELYLYDVNSINSPSNKRNKRVLDVISSLLLLLSSPLLVWFMNRKAGYIKNCFTVFSGRNTWVGYKETRFRNSSVSLPGIRPGILHPIDAVDTDLRNDDIPDRLNLLYAREYRIGMDIRIMLRNFKSLGR
jgi:GT2 family glycosyltransferase